MEDSQQDLRLPMRTMNGKEVLADILRAEGVEHVFGIPGATEIQFMDALDSAPDIGYVLGLHEVVCAGMAEGYARATGRPGFLNLHTATGLAAATPMLYNAQLGHVPLVVTVGQNDTRLLQRDPHLTGDIVGAGKIYAKWSTELVHAQDLPVVLRRAFKMATQPPAGPVVVSIPQNILQQTLDPATGPYRPGDCEIGSRTRPSSEAIDCAVEILREARHPLLLLESGVARSAAVEEVVQFAETIGARVYQGWMSDVNFPNSHPLYLGDLDPAEPAAAPVLAQADVLIGIGCSLFSHGFIPQEPQLPRDLKLIHVDDDPWELGKNLPTDCCLLGDIKATVNELNAALGPRLSPEARSAVAARCEIVSAEKRQAAARWEEQLASAGDTTPVSVPRLMRELRSAVGARTVVVDEAWSASSALRQTLSLDAPGTFFRSRKGGSIGSGLPMALGVQLGLPDNQVLAVVGDGSAAWSMQSLWSAARYEIPATFLITNNATYRQVKLVRRAVLGDYPLDERHQGMDIDEPVVDFSRLAQAMGVEAVRISHAGEIAQAVRRGLDSKRPHLIEVMVESAAS